MLYNTYGHSVIRVVVVIVCCWGDAASPVGTPRPLPVGGYCACVGISGFLDVGPVAHHALPVIAAHVQISFRSHDGYMWVWHARCLAFQWRQQHVKVTSTWYTISAEVYCDLPCTSQHLVNCVSCVYQIYCVSVICVQLLCSVIVFNSWSENVLLSLLFMHYVHSVICVCRLVCFT